MRVELVLVTGLPWIPPLWFVAFPHKNFRHQIPNSCICEESNNYILTIVPSLSAIVIVLFFLAEIQSI